MVFELALLSLLVPEPPAPPASIDLQWNAPPGCSSAEAVQARVAALLSGPPRGQGEAVVVASVVREGEAVSMTLTTTFAGATDVREVTSTSCEALADATAVLLAVSLEPSLDVQPEPEPEPEPEPVPVPPVVSDAAPAPALPRIAEPAAASESAPEPVESPPPAAGPWPVALHGGLETGLEGGALVDPAAAVRAAFGVGQDRWQVEVLGTYLVPRARPEALVQAGTVGLRGCWTPGRAPWTALLCGGGDIGGFRAESRGLDPPVSRLGPYAGPAASIGAAWSGARVGFTLRAEAVARLWGSETTRAGVALSTQRFISARLLAGVRVHFGGRR